MREKGGKDQLDAMPSLFGAALPCDGARSGHTWRPSSISPSSFVTSKRGRKEGRTIEQSEVSAAAVGAKGRGRSGKARTLYSIFKEREREERGAEREEEKPKGPLSLSSSRLPPDPLLLSWLFLPFLLL